MDEAGAAAAGGGVRRGDAEHVVGQPVPAAHRLRAAPLPSGGPVAANARANNAREKNAREKNARAKRAWVRGSKPVSRTQSGSSEGRGGSAPSSALASLGAGLPARMLLRTVVMRARRLAAGSAPGGRRCAAVGEEGGAGSAAASAGRRCSIWRSERRRRRRWRSKYV